MRERIINWPQIRDWWKVGEKSVERRSSEGRSPGVEISICVFYYNIPHGIMGALLPLEELHAFFPLSVIRAQLNHALSASQGECQLPSSQSHL